MVIFSPLSFSWAEGRWQMGPPGKRGMTAVLSNVSSYLVDDQVFYPPYWTAYTIGTTMRNFP